jgi:deoxyribodipyrimidine photo-lyase
MVFMHPPIVIHWFRRDLRLEDNHGLREALKSGFPVLGIFIFDKDILDALPSRRDARVEFIHSSLQYMNTQLEKIGSSLYIAAGHVDDVFERLSHDFNINKIYANVDYEPGAIARDLRVKKKMMEARGIAVEFYKDQVIWEKSECVKDDGTAYCVFTPYSRKWLRLLAQKPPAVFETENILSGFLKKQFLFPTLSDLGFESSGIQVPERKIKYSLLSAYSDARNRMDFDSTSKLGVHLRFGTLSVRKAVKAASCSSVWLNELIWREFFMQILFHFPRTVDEPARNPAFMWRTSPDDFQRWATGTTGYPIVDAGMRELITTGFMHNRARMVTASFLTKHLLLNWKLGERYFAAKLLDFELASNVGNWQWVAGTGFDAAPYFRIFNPYTQAQKFDPDSIYVKKWIPELGTKNYPKPMIEHEVARKRALQMYEDARSAK